MRDKPESCLRPFLFFFFLKHGKQIFYVILVRNKILSSIPFAQLFFSYDKVWYHVFNENFYLELPLSCETDYLNVFIKLFEKQTKLAFLKKTHL